MEVYRFRIPERVDDVSPWHFLELGQKQNISLNLAKPLTPIWQPPRYRVIVGADAPDFFFGLTEVAVSERVKNEMSPRIGMDVEFLPIVCDYHELLYIVHATRIVELGSKAIVSKNPVSHDISLIMNHDFKVEALSSCTLFRIAQPPGSSAAGAGLAFREIFAVGDFVEFLVTEGFRGVEFVKVFESG